MLHIIIPKITLNVEKWKWNKEFGLYVSNKGNFKNKYKKELKILVDRKSGYLRIPTEKGIKYAHRVVLLTWKPIKDSDIMTVDHLNHNKRDNKIANLEWVTKEENFARAENDIFKEEELSHSVNNFIYIIAKKGKEKIVFKDIDRAINWCINVNHISEENINRKKIENKIINASKNNKTYSSMNWFLKEVI